MKGKGVFIWQTSRVENGDLARIVGRVRDLGIERVELKTTDGNRPFSVLGRGRNVTIEIVQAFRNAGISVYGWGFNYGIDPVGEGVVAAQEAIALGLDGHIFNGEGAFIAKAVSTNVVDKLVSSFQRRAPGLPIGFCSFALYNVPDSGAQIHSMSVLHQMSSRCQFGMPECYWFDGHSIEAYTSPFDLTVEAVRQWTVAGFKNVIPVGRAYYGEGGKADPVSMMAFYEALTVTLVNGYSLWSLQHIRPATASIVGEWPLMGKPIGLGLTLEERVAILEGKVTYLYDKLSG
jgi:hypothetical protein